MTRRYPETRSAVFAGTFNPFTIGHADIVRRALEIFDSVHICVGVNLAKQASHEADEQRARSIKALWADDPRVTAECWGGLTADYAAKVGASHLLRGVRSVKDYEYERDMADANRAISGLDTVILFAAPELAFVTSSLVRELQAHGKDASRLLPLNLSPANISKE